MNDLTILYYTANHIQGYFAENVREHLLRVIEDAPLISISHRPINFGNNICVGDIGISTYNIYKQILIGAKEANTDFIGCAEDDCLYTKSHFAHRPPDLETFSYNNNRWGVLSSGKFFHRNRAVMSMCIAPRLKLIEVLGERFVKNPVMLSREELYGWGEPGREKCNRVLEENCKLEIFESDNPTVHFNLDLSMGKSRRLLRKDIIVDNLPFWGKASELWKEYTANECSS